MNFSNCIKYSNDVQFSYDANYLAIAKGPNLVVYESFQMQTLFKLTFPCSITQLEFSKDSVLILIGLGKLNQCIIKSLEDITWECKISESSFGISNCIWSPDSAKVLIISNYNIKLGIWSIIEETQPQYISLPKFSHRGLSFSSNNSFMALIERKDNKDYIGVYFIGDFSLLNHFILNTTDAQDVIWSKDNTALITYDSPIECKILIYSPTGNLLMMNEAYTDNMGVISLSLSPNGHYITGGYGDNKIRIFNHMTYKLIATLDNILTEENIKNTTFHIFKEVDVKSGSEIKTTKFEPQKYTSNLIKKSKISNEEEEYTFILEYSYDSNYLAVNVKDYPNIVWIWQLSSLSLTTMIIFQKNINVLKWSPSEHKLIIGTDNSRCYFFSLDNIYVIELPTPNMKIIQIKWNYDGKSFLLCDKCKLLIGFSDIEEI